MIWYILLGIVLLSFLIKITLFFIHLFSKKKEDPIKTFAFNRIENIITYAKLLTKNIEKELGKQSPLLIYEQLFYLYFIDDVKLVCENCPEDVRQLTQGLLFKSLSYTKNIEYQNNKKLIADIFNLRQQQYTKFMQKDDFKFSNQFFYNIIDFQVELLACIQKHDTFSKYDPFASPLEASKKDASGLVHTAQLKSVLAQNLELIIKFYQS